MCCGYDPPCSPSPAVLLIPRDRLDGLLEVPRLARVLLGVSHRRSIGRPGNGAVAAFCAGHWRLEGADEYVAAAARWVRRVQGHTGPGRPTAPIPDPTSALAKEGSRAVTGAVPCEEHRRSPHQGSS